MQMQSQAYILRAAWHWVFGRGGVVTRQFVQIVPFQIEYNLIIGMPEDGILTFQSANEIRVSVFHFHFYRRLRFSTVHPAEFVQQSKRPTGVSTYFVML